MADAAAATQEQEVDYGDNLTPEQEALAKARNAEKEGPPMSDDEVDAALKALAGGETEKTEEVAQEGAAPTEETEPASAGKTDEEGKFIPKDRFDEAVKKERDKRIAAENELKRLKQEAPRQEQSPAAPATTRTIDDDIAAAKQEVLDTRTSWQTALLDNDQAEANRLLAQMTAAEERLDELRLEQASFTTRRAATEDISFDTELKRLEQTFPQINQDAEEYDAEIDRKVTRLFNGLVNGGTNRIDALREAASVYLKPAKKESKKEETEETLRDKAKTALKETVTNQPPVADGPAATKQPVLRPSRMTEEQFGKLSEEQKAVLRGDVV